MKTALAALLSGLLFGAGLAISGMTDPAKVLNFLDVAGSWDGSLGLVMAGALSVTAPGFAIARRRAQPILAPRFELPTLTDVDWPLVAGAVLFGLGWGLVGLCPGPALASLGIAAKSTALFVAALVVGSVVGNRLRR